MEVGIGDVMCWVFELVRFFLLLIGSIVLFKAFGSYCLLFLNVTLLLGKRRISVGTLRLRKSHTPCIKHFPYLVSKKKYWNVYMVKFVYCWYNILFFRIKFIFNEVQQKLINNYNKLYFISIHKISILVQSKVNSKQTKYWQNQA